MRAETLSRKRREGFAIRAISAKAVVRCREALIWLGALHQAIRDIPNPEYPTRRFFGREDEALDNICHALGLDPAEVVETIQREGLL